MRSVIEKSIETTNVYPNHVVMMELGDGRRALASVNPLDPSKSHAIQTAVNLLKSQFIPMGFGTRFTVFEIKETESGIPVWACHETPKSADCPQKKEDKPKPLTIWDMVKAIKDKFNITPKSVGASVGGGLAAYYYSFSVYKEPSFGDCVFSYNFSDTNSGSVGSIEYVLNSLSKRLKMVPTSDGKETIWDAIFAIKDKFGIVPVEVETDVKGCHPSAMYECFNIYCGKGNFSMGRSKGLAWPPIHTVGGVADVLQTIKAYKLTGE